MARATGIVDPAEGERLLRAALDQATAEQDYGLASNIVGDLVSLLKDAGRLREALNMVNEGVDYTRRAGLGPWAQLADRGKRLQILRRLGEPERILAEVHQMREQMANLPEQAANNDPATPWNVREATLNLGVGAALNLGRWQEVMDLNEATLDSLRRRSASAHQIAFTRFNNCTPLIRLGRLDEAEQLLLECQQVFEDHNDIGALATTLSARAELAAERGHVRDAIDLAHTSLRLKYVKPDPREIGLSHHTLANYLGQAAADPVDGLAHHLAAGIIYQLTGGAYELPSTLRALAQGLLAVPDTAPPATIAQLAERVERVDGVHFAALVNALAGDPDTAEQTLTDVIQAARDLPTDDAINVHQYLDEWDPHIAAIVAAAGGDTSATQAVNEVLGEGGWLLVRAPGWASVAAVLRRVVAGERDPEQLLTDLDPINTAVVQRTLDALAGRIALNPSPDEPTDTLDEQTEALAAVVAAAVDGDSDAKVYLDQQLDEWNGTAEWVDLAAVLRRVLAGDRDPVKLLASLDDFDARIVTTVLARLANNESRGQL